jgi:hypothetical protein
LHERWPDRDARSLGYAVQYLSSLLQMPPRDAPRPGPDTPAPPRFLPSYDNVLLAHADRTRVIPHEPRVQFFPSDGLLVGTVLIDGFLGARWKIRRDGGKATLIIEAFERLRRQDRTALAAEGARLVAFAAAESGERASVEIRPVRSRG